MKETIEQIKKISGVESVEWHNNRVVVVFEPKQNSTIVYCETPKMTPFTKEALRELERIGNLSNWSDMCNLSNIHLNEIEQITMKTKIIEEIKKIKGVESVTDSFNELTVKLEPKEIAVHCTNREQLVFTYVKRIGIEFTSTESEGYIYLNNIKGWGTEIWKLNTTVITFEQYLKDYDCLEEWKAFLFKEAKNRGFKEGVYYSPLYCGSQKFMCHGSLHYGYDGGINLYFEKGQGLIYKNGQWPDIVDAPSDVPKFVDGEIYAVSGESLNYCFRFKRERDLDSAFYYSLECPPGFKLNDWCIHTSKVMTVKEASDKQKKELIKAEVKNGFFYELQTIK